MTSALHVFSIAALICYVSVSSIFFYCLIYPEKMHSKIVNCLMGTGLLSHVTILILLGFYDKNSSLNSLTSILTSKPTIPMIVSLLLMFFMYFYLKKKPISVLPSMVCPIALIYFLESSFLFHVPEALSNLKKTNPYEFNGNIAIVISLLSFSFSLAFSMSALIQERRIFQHRISEIPIDSLSLRGLEKGASWSCSVGLVSTVAAVPLIFPHNLSNAVLFLVYFSLLLLYFARHFNRMRLLRLFISGFAVFLLSWWKFY